MEVVPESEGALSCLDDQEFDGHPVPEDDPSLELLSTAQSSLPPSGDGLSDLGSGFEHIEPLPDAQVFPGDLEIPSSRASSPAPSAPMLAQTSPVRGSNTMMNITTTPPRSLIAPQSSPVKSSTSFQDLPQPKRATALHHKRQFKKLSAPFRPPHMKVKEEEPAAKSLKRERDADDATVFPPAKKREDSQLKHRTIRAAGQFKSPVVGASSGPQVELVKMTPTIQALERRVQHLKRATKVRRDGEEEELRGLTAKWTEAGREVAWELWELVKENDSACGGNWNGTASGGAKRSFEDSWGWSEQGDKKRARTDNWGWDEKKEGDDHQAEDVEIESGRDEREEEEDKVEWTLGLMLRQFGIDPQTLGWNENDGMFM
ncbi:hypothetical protein CYLTODRAFT_283869 [Cylindrobasidium torrendii FP15055 ss-10]|uniref:Uncharacterized protein n=1 Tax=Cylindrobasidium torrendii FP15055 ss-10 TaxID=1314674 RepID=A0A0D7BQU0_9AGAR|nr:hypothetical protein CYLTODRAFT_283869 [Cylindrobasidium torrendii FP15055 ss-10]